MEDVTLEIDRQLQSDPMVIRPMEMGFQYDYVAPGDFSEMTFLVLLDFRQRICWP
jgi:hypothetical protein